MYFVETHYFYNKYGDNDDNGVDLCHSQFRQSASTHRPSSTG